MSVTVPIGERGVSSANHQFDGGGGNGRSPVVGTSGRREDPLISTAYKEVRTLLKGKAAASASPHQDAAIDGSNQSGDGISCDGLGRYGGSEGQDEGEWIPASRRQRHGWTVGRGGRGGRRGGGSSASRKRGSGAAGSDAISQPRCSGPLAPMPPLQSTMCEHTQERPQQQPRTCPRGAEVSEDLLAQKSPLPHQQGHTSAETSPLMSQHQAHKRSEATSAPTEVSPPRSRAQVCGQTDSTPQEVSPDDKLIAYTEDTEGNEIYTIYVIDAENGSAVGEPLVGTLTYNIQWVDNDTLAYVTMDATQRDDKVWLHKLLSDQSSDRCIYHEDDDTFSVGLSISESMQYIFVRSGSANTNFIFYLEISNQEAGLITLTPRVNGVVSYVSHRGNHFFITRRSEEYYNSEVVACRVDNVSEMTVLIPHRKSVKIQRVRLFSDHIVLLEREDGLPKITIYELPSASETIGSLQGGRAIEFADPIYSVDVEESQFNSKVMRFTYSSMRTPSSVYDYDMGTRISVVKKTEPVLSGFNASNYVVERQWAVAADGTPLPISIMYRKDLFRFDGSNPLLLYGYGSYEATIDASFVDSLLTLIDRRFVYAIAHVRGGGEMGRGWYDNGKLLNKKNTFTDFITCTEYLIEKRYTSKGKVCIEGASAGGLLVASVLNMRPDLFKAVVAYVPFVDVLTTMLDPSIPLTTSEYQEWGDPRQKEYYFYINSYSPVDNIKSQKYPSILVTAGLNDPRVLYSEPAKYVAKLREMKTDDNLLLFKCELEAGHYSESGRDGGFKEEAFKYAFILKAMDMIPSISYRRNN